MYLLEAREHENRAQQQPHIFVRDSLFFSTGVKGEREV